MPEEMSRPLPPNSVIGIIGGGQLGRMIALAASRLGYKCHIFCPEAYCPAALVAYAHTIADYEDHEALEKFANQVDVVTFEFENIPFESVQLLANKVPVRPNWTALHISQDRLLEKSFVNKAGVPTTEYREVKTLADLEKAVDEIGRPSILKTTRLGYDGKGQVVIRDDTRLDHAFQMLNGAVGILEGYVTYQREMSVIIARGLDGNWKAFGPMENRHVSQILDTTIAPAPISQERAVEAIELARKIAEAMKLVGLLAVELFQTPDNKLLVNELAPRPHNSGHWTQDGCYTDQFEQLVRAVCGLPLGSTERRCDVVMKNLIGDDVNAWQEYLGQDEARLHLYGKREARPGRKMGHVNFIHELGSLAKKY